MDDVIFSRNFDEHLECLIIVLEKMQRVGLTVQPKKVQLASFKVDLICFVVDDGHLCPNDAKHHDIKSLQHFLSMTAFCRAFMPRCAELTVLPNQLMHKGVKWNLGKAQQKTVPITDQGNCCNSRTTPSRPEQVICAASRC